MPKKTNLSVVTEHKLAPDPEIIQIAEQVLEMAKAGNVTALAYAMTTNGGYANVWASARAKNGYSTEILGSLQKLIHWIGNCAVAGMEKQQ